MVGRWEEEKLTYGVHRDCPIQQRHRFDTETDGYPEDLLDEESQKETVKWISRQNWDDRAYTRVQKDVTM